MIVIVVEPVLGIEDAEKFIVPRMPVVVSVADAVPWFDPAIVPDGIVLTKVPSDDATTEKVKVQEVPPLAVAEAAGSEAPTSVAEFAVTSTDAPWQVVVPVPDAVMPFGRLSVMEKGPSGIAL